ncbi:MAG: 2-C-methyl-D-erythritol 4-phosphate cytidylyltransferase [Oscillospiraceae bacterium]|nr:2-C-methyl-D-erythritol 4-phosphate cytidylyltransferase [Oscillospiraceae bacterium]
MSLLSLLKKTSTKKPPNCTAVIAAAGTSARCNGEDKLMFKLGGKPVLAHTVEVFEKCQLINEIIIVTMEEKLEAVGKMCEEYGYDKVALVLCGGITRLESVIHGIYAASKKARLIAIHDGARPCLEPELLEKTIRKAAKYNAAAPGISITSTVKRVKNEIIKETVDREGLVEIQTPQIFRAEIIKAALTNALNKDIKLTDDCEAVENIGMPVYIVEGSQKNIKITTPDDLALVELYLNNTQ